MKILFLPFLLLPLFASAAGTGPVSRAFDSNKDDPGRLAPGEKLERNISRIGLVTSGRMNEIPWSDRAWDHNRALLNERYTDRNFLRLNSWPARREYALDRNVRRALAISDPQKRDRLIATLSPAEKYDLLVGTVDNGLAEANRALLDREMDGSGRFPTWWGICDGSAAASLASPEPVKSFRVYSEAYGVNVTFYAPDVKALVSMLWSTYNRRLRLPESGQQCDQTSGGSCADVNPASFHRALHHFLGENKGQLLMDVDPTRVVWNHPVYGYQTYYHLPNRNRRERAASFREALLPVSEAGGDPRKNLRAPGTAYLLGVVTRVQYGENQRQHPLEGSVKQRLTTMELQYELELDENLNLIGGEWRSQRHPDLLWSIPQGVRPETDGDLFLGQDTWDGESIPASWNGAARRSAAKVMPLRKVVDGLVRRARQ